MPATERKTREKPPPGPRVPVPPEKPAVGLRPCPWCGGSDLVMHMRGLYHTPLCVQCLGCGATGPSAPEAPCHSRAGREEFLRLAWDQRAGSAT